MEQSSLNLAVLIDGDNINPAYLGRIFAWATDHGDVIMRRIYCNDIVQSSWKKCINVHKLSHVKNYADGRNATDFTMTIDAIDITTARKNIDGFCIVAADNGYVSLVNRLHRNHFVAVLWCHDLNKPSPSFGYECDEFVYVAKLPENNDPDADVLPAWKDIIKKAVVKSAGRDGWAYISDVGGRLNQLKLSDYCHTRLATLIETCDEFEILTDRQLVRLRPR